MKFFLSLLLFILVSCEKKESKINELYDILNLIYPSLSFEIPPPPPPAHLIKDSLYLNNIRTKQIIAINPELRDSKKFINFKKHPFNEIDFEPVILDIDSINIDLIISAEDSIITFSKELLEPSIKDYLKFDKLISFSKVYFDKNFNHAIVIGNASTSSLAGSSHVFFLRKEEGKWRIVDVQLLEIS